MNSKTITLGGYTITTKEYAYGHIFISEAIDNRTGQPHNPFHPWVLPDGATGPLEQFLYLHTWSVSDHLPRWFRPVQTCNHRHCLNPRHLLPMDDREAKGFAQRGEEYLAGTFGLDRLGVPACKNSKNSLGTGEVLSPAPNKAGSPSGSRAVQVDKHLVVVSEDHRGCHPCIGYWVAGRYHLIISTCHLRCPSVTVHRAYRSHHGDIPDGQRLIQICGNGHCLNPGHLILIPEQLAPDFYFMYPEMREQWVAQHMAAAMQTPAG